MLDLNQHLWKRTAGKEYLTSSRNGPGLFLYYKWLHIQYQNSLFSSVFSSVAQAWPLMVHTQCLSRIIPDYVQLPWCPHRSSHLSVKGSVHATCDSLASLSLLQMASNSIFHRWFERGRKRKQAEEMCSFWQETEWFTFCGNDGG